MTDFALPKLVASAAPEFTDPATAKVWLEHVPLANVAAAQHDLRLQIEEFNVFDCKAVTRLAIMEALREAVNFVQIEQAKRFTNRTLPMGEDCVQSSCEQRLVFPLPQWCQARPARGAERKRPVARAALGLVQAQARPRGLRRVPGQDPPHRDPRARQRLRAPRPQDGRLSMVAIP